MLALSGDVHLDDFAEAISELRALMGELDKEVARGVEIDWSVDSLESGSAFTTIRGSAQEPDQQQRVQEVVRAYARVGMALEQGRDVPYSPSVAKAANNITNILNGRIREISFETDEVDAVVTSAPASATERPSAVFAYGAIEGRVQTLSSRTGLKFTLYDAFGNAVRCHLSGGNEDMMRDAWDKLVVVEGRVRRDPTGKPISVRETTDVVIREPTEPGDYREARGAMSVGPGASPEEAIRRLRDA